MNKIITILILTSMAFSTYVQFNVDMSQEDVGEEYPTLWIGSFYPNPGFALEDPDADGVWSLLLDLEPGIYTYKFRNGAWTDWNTGSGWESLLGQNCAVGDWSDREVVVGIDPLQLDTVCFSSCTSDCLIVNSYDVTFQVDLNDIDGFNPADGVYVQGTFNGWCGYCNPLSDDNGDYIYRLTINIPTGEYEYIYTTNGWDGLQGFAPLNSSCDYLPDDSNANYGFDLSDQNLILDIIPFGACNETGGDTGGGDPAYQVIFDLDGLGDCGFVSVTGTWDSWSGWGAHTDSGMSAAIAGGDHEFIILCVDTAANAEWYNDIWGSSTIYYAPIDGSCSNGDSEFSNYVLTVDGDQTVSYCAGSCDATCSNPACGDGECNGDETQLSCPADCEDSGVQIDFPVDFEGSMVNYTMTDFGGNISSLVADPYDTGNMAIKIVKGNQAATWAGTTIGTPAGFATNIPLTLSNSVMAVRVWSAQSGTTIRLKVEDSNNNTHTCETETNTTASGWQVLEFDFIDQAPGTELLSVGLGFGWTYNMASIYFNFGTEGAGETYYFDDVSFGGICGTGDVTDDGELNILDVVTMVNYILGNQTPSDEQICSSDMNGDGSLNVLDIVGVVGIILNSRASDSAERVELNQSNSGLSFEADGYVGAIQMAIRHDEDFIFNLTKKAFVADSKTENNTTTILVVNPQNGEIFTSKGTFNIESVIAASVDGYIDTQINVPAGFIISDAYPNPFNPSTSISIHLNIDSNVSMKIFNVMGQLINVLFEGQMTLGTHSFTWDASNYPSGIYIISSLIGDDSQVQKVMLLK